MKTIIIILPKPDKNHVYIQIYKLKLTLYLVQIRRKKFKYDLKQNEMIKTHRTKNMDSRQNNEPSD